jgi:hypothetical protein
VEVATSPEAGVDSLRAAFGSGWRIVSLARDRFDVNPSVGTPAKKPVTPT